jgi:two-component system nitrate/nitrite response regulator NarL
LGGLRLIEALKHRKPQVKSLVLMADGDEAVMFDALRAGANGFVSKNSGVGDLAKAIHAVHAGELWATRALMARFVGVERDHDGDRGSVTESKETLTAREQEILRLLAAGGSNKDIAQALFISEKTVKTHLHNIFHKLHVTRRLSAVMYAIRQGLR